MGSGHQPSAPSHDRRLRAGEAVGAAEHFAGDHRHVSGRSSRRWSRARPSMHWRPSSLRFTSARTAVPLTLPSHAAIMTGLLPPRDGVRDNGVDTLSTGHPTIARLLREAGYRTAAFVGAFVLDHRFGLAQGFDTYDDQIARDPNASERLEAERPASEVVDRAIAWLERTNDRGPGTDQAPGTTHRAPFFVWIHLYDPHAPYTPPARFAARTRTPYDGEVAFADEQIARVFEWLRAHGQTDRTLIVVSGDHGEGLGDHGERTHGMLLYDSTLRVPLIVAAPGQRTSDKWTKPSVSSTSRRRSCDSQAQGHQPR